jgi:predicted DCC family thiol-disulfide oxidoreductase YuxK
VVPAIEGSNPFTHPTLKSLGYLTDVILSTVDKSSRQSSTNTLVGTVVIDVFSLAAAIIFTHATGQLLFPILIMGSASVITFFRLRRQPIPSTYQRQLIVYFDGDCAFCKCVLSVIHRVLLLKRIEYQRGDSSKAVNQYMNETNSWLVWYHDGDSYIRSEALMILLTHSPLFISDQGYIFILMKLLKSPLDLLYRVIANQRSIFSKIIKCRA